MALHDDDRGRLAGQLATVSGGARGQQRVTYVLLALLGLMVIGAAVAGVVVDSDVYWGAAGGAFFTACGGLIAYAGTRLGIFGQMVDLIRLDLQRAPSAQAGDGSNAVTSTSPGDATVTSSEDDAEEDSHRRVRKAMAHITPEEGKGRLAERRSGRTRVARSRTSEDDGEDQPPAPG